MREKRKRLKRRIIGKQKRMCRTCRWSERYLEDAERIGRGYCFHFMSLPTYPCQSYEGKEVIKSMIVDVPGDIFTSAAGRRRG